MFITDFTCIKLVVLIANCWTEKVLKEVKIAKFCVQRRHLKELLILNVRSVGKLLGWSMKLVVFSQLQVVSLCCLEIKPPYAGHSEKVSAGLTLSQGEIFCGPLTSAELLFVHFSRKNGTSSKHPSSQAALLNDAG
jgi:hypothetical protein